MRTLGAEAATMGVSGENRRRVVLYTEDCPECDAEAAMDFIFGSDTDAGWSASQ